MMRQDRFTEQAQEVLQASQELVREARHSQWDVEHVLYALVQRKDGLAREVLTRMGIDSDALGRVVNFFRRPPQFGLYSPVPMRQWQIIALPITPGEAPQPLDDTRYTSEADAIHAVFLRHIAQLGAE